MWVIALWLLPGPLEWHEKPQAMGAESILESSPSWLVSKGAAKLPLGGPTAWSHSMWLRPYPRKELSWRVMWATMAWVILWIGLHGAADFETTCSFDISISLHLQCFWFRCSTGACASLHGSPSFCSYKWLWCSNSLSKSHGDFSYHHPGFRLLPYHVSSSSSWYCFFLIGSLYCETNLKFETQSCGLLGGGGWLVLF